ncbi:hypothetical protein [Streptomyces inhibens]|uniref:hypothetical protein n=1 Tax=Streptomyces inhibens TaxID=2293571 RepID=UPI001EE704B3|nr:hypothetical protein [Streptomyces inhibens]UKY51474.1 hypothetical protein KI385_23450 [Streptomyces inhibens]
MADEGSGTVDPERPVVRLCVEGMQAEAEGRAEVARGLFQRAWDIAADDYEACIAAHYLARHQNSPEETLRWNQECLDRADRVGDERVRGFYPSLYVNMGQAYRKLGQPAPARTYFVRAAERVTDAPDGQYGDWNRFAIAEGLRETEGLRGTERLRGAESLHGTASAVAGDVSEEEGTAGVAPSRRALDEAVDGRVRELLSRWCARADLKALGLTLPAYLGYLGTDEDRMRLRTALHSVHAARWLPEDEQTELGAVIGAAALR